MRVDSIHHNARASARQETPNQEPYLVLKSEGPVALREAEDKNPFLPDESMSGGRIRPTYLCSQQRAAPIRNSTIAGFGLRHISRRALATPRKLQCDTTRVRLDAILEPALPEETVL